MHGYVRLHISYIDHMNQVQKCTYPRALSCFLPFSSRRYCCRGCGCHSDCHYACFSCFRFLWLLLGVVATTAVLIAATVASAGAGGDGSLFHPKTRPHVSFHQSLPSCDLATATFGRHTCQRPSQRPRNHDWQRAYKGIFKRSVVIPSAYFEKQMKKLGVSFQSTMVLYSSARLVENKWEK